MEHDILVAVLRRSGPFAKRRALVMIHALRSLQAPDVCKVLQCDSPATSEADTTHSAAVDADSSSTAKTPSKRRAAPAARPLSQFLELEDIVTVMMYAVEPAPRFIFACGSGGTFVRSADRGKTWRRIEAVAASSPEEAAGEQKGQQSADDVVDAQLNDILSLLPKGDMTTTDGGGDSGSESDCDTDDAGEKGANAKAPTTAVVAEAKKAVSAINQNAPKHLKLTREKLPDLHGCAVSGDFVAVCGANGTLAMSTDKGLRFTPLAKCPALGAKKGAAEFLTLKSLRFIGGSTIIFHSTTSLFSVSFDVAGTGTSFGDVKLLHKFTGTIGSLSVLRSPGEVLCVTTHGGIHLSLDQGRHFVTILHTLGLIRGLVDVTDHHAPPNKDGSFPTAEEEDAEQQGSQQAAGNKDGAASVATTTATTASAKERKKYSYHTQTQLAVESTATARSEPLDSSELELWLRQLLRRQTSPKKNNNSQETKPTQCFASFACMCTQGPLIAYDFSVVASIVLEERVLDTVSSTMTAMDEASSSGLVTLQLNVEHVDYIPFQQTSANEKAGIGMTLEPAESGSSHATGRSRRPDLVLFRSTSSGVSRSVDGGATWSPPALAYAGAICRLEGGGMVACNQRKSVAITEDFGANWALKALPAKTKAVTLSSIDVMV